jgi:AraC family transcriptional regulator
MRIPELWDVFVRDVDGVKGRVGRETFGPGFAWPAARDGLFSYTAAVAVSSIEDLPDGWRGRTIDAHEYAVFTHPGTVADMRATVKYIWEEWVPSCGLRTAASPDFELYDDIYQRGEGKVQIWVPIQR